MKREWWSALLMVLLSFPLIPLHGHPVGPLGGEPLKWRNDHVSRVIAGGSPVHLPGRDIVIGGRSCVKGALLNFNVRDTYAFDIDESVQLILELHSSSNAKEVLVRYDRNDAASSDPRSIRRLAVPDFSGGTWSTATVSLDRARFSNNAFSGTDFQLSANGPANPAAKAQVVICGVSIQRSYDTQVPTEFGHVHIEAIDETGRITPVRLGVYDSTRRMPLPSEDAVPVRMFDDVNRMIALRPGSVAWPTANRSAFYINGRYGAQLPVGEYEVIAAKGIEYHLVRQAFKVTSNGMTTVKLQLQRWKNLAASGWFSGDDHVHYTRSGKKDDETLLQMIRAEDLRVANILQVGNSGRLYFRQDSWHPILSTDPVPFVLVPGQEDPRTTRHGHTIQLNIRKPVRDPLRYLLYHEVFEKVKAQRGIVGYAHSRDHITDLSVGSRRGLALDVPFGLVDFVEIMQGGEAYAKTWFDFLNLGYKLVPSAGTDYPYIDAPGAVRCYVRVNGDFSPQAWFDGLAAGRNFVSNGPMIEFRVNQQEIGSELSLRTGEAIVIEATATINPDVDLLDRLELIEQGEVIHVASSPKGDQELRLNYRIPAKHGTWFVIRAHGKQQNSHANVLALSAPIYVRVDGKSFWKPSVVPAIVADLKQNMQELLKPVSEHFEFEGWDTEVPDAKHWDSQRGLLRERIEKVTALYDNLVEQATRE